MNAAAQTLRPPGEPASLSDLRSPKGTKFAEYLHGVGRDAFVMIKEVRRQSAPPADVIVFDIEPQRPQRLQNDIKKVETIAVMFGDDDKVFPEVLALRDDFPMVAHINRRKEEFPRSLCLYDQSWSDEKSSWTPVAFLQRIHVWLSGTADGTLHASDQPLEPLIMEPNWLLIVPPDFESDIRREPTRQLSIMGGTEHAQRFTVLTQWQGAEIKAPPRWLCATFECAAQTHGVIRRTPQNLEDLHALCRDGGLELLDAVRDRIESWLKKPPAPGYLDAWLIIILILPKTRVEGGAIERVETRAFLTANKVREIGAVLGISGAKPDVGGGAIGLILFPEKPDPKKFSDMVIMPMGIYQSLDQETAAAMNGAEPIEQKMVAVGAGAFGSQVLNNLVRAGVGRWTIVDNDLLMPHNFARHLLPAECVGKNKAEAVAAFLTVAISILGFQIKPIPADVLDPKEHEKALRDAETEADIIFDFSASVAVARHIGRGSSKARCASGFVTPSGSGMVMLLEDSKRHYRLDWLEALHYRAILNNRGLALSLKPSDGRIRTGGSCRDISVLLAQADTATWAGTFSQQLAPLLSTEVAAVKIFQRKPDGGVDAYTETPEPLVIFRIDGWTILLDAWALRKLSGFREKTLPNETGGVLLGVIDTEAHRCAIVDVLPSPPDSIEWPNSYIRGCADLLPKIKEAEAATAGQVTYVGEWHSHPRGASTSPSSLDLEAYSILKEQRDAECLPTLMIIIGDALESSLVAGELTEPETN